MVMPSIVNKILKQRMSCDRIAKSGNHQWPSKDFEESSDSKGYEEID
jgi:hypothetical protein